MIDIDKIYNLIDRRSDLMPHIYITCNDGVSEDGHIRYVGEGFEFSPYARGKKSIILHANPLLVEFYTKSSWIELKRICLGKIKDIEKKKLENNLLDQYLGFNFD